VPSFSITLDVFLPFSRTDFVTYKDVEFFELDFVSVMQSLRSIILWHIVAFLSSLFDKKSGPSP